MLTNRNQESKNQPIGDKEKKRSECGMLILNVLSHLLSTFMMEAAISNGFSIQHLRILNTCSNLKVNLIIF
jgi:hypothetical protein